MGKDYQDWIRKVVIPVSFRSLTDTPGSFDGAAKKTIVVNDTETALVYSDLNVDDHSARHEEGGADEINVTGLSGVLADEQNLVDHASEHEAGASDELGPIGNKTNGVIRLTNPGGATNNWVSSGKTGAIQINLPAAADDMIYFKASVYDHVGKASFDVIIFGQIATRGPYWNECTAVIIGDNPNIKRVRFCRNSDSSQYYVIIGDTGTSWGYPWIAITDLKAGYTPTITDWNNGWSMSLITSMPSYTDFDFTDARVSPKDHAFRHEDGGVDTIQIVNLPDYEETTVELGGDFDAGESVKCIKNGNIVCITSLGSLSHSSTSSPSSGVGAIPSAYRPANNVFNVYYIYSDQINRVLIVTDGKLKITYCDWSGSFISESQSYGFSITYNI